MAMRGFLSYLLAGTVVVLAMDFVVAPNGLTPSLAAPVAEQSLPQQLVNRSNKSDRMPVASQVRKDQPQKARRVMVGCDPVYSTLAASAQANFAGRCIS
jgi:hypothetical protein